MHGDAEESNQQNPNRQNPNQGDSTKSETTPGELAVKSNRPVDLAQLGVPLLIGVGVLSISMLALATPHSSPIVAGIAWGTLFGHFVATGFMMVTQDGTLGRRLAITFVWLTSLVVSFFGAATASSQRFDGVALASFFVAIIGWVTSIVTAMALWTVRRVFDLRVTREMGEKSSDARRYQFSIRQLLLITTVIAVLLGVGRVVVQPVLATDSLQQHIQGLVVTSLIALAAVTTQVPNWLAMLLPNKWGYGLLFTLALTIVITGAEVQLIISTSLRVIPEIPWILSYINAIATGWVLAFAFMYRCARYRVIRFKST